MVGWTAKKGCVKSARNQFVCMKELMNAAEPKEVCLKHTKWRTIVWLPRTLAPVEYGMSLFLLLFNPNVEIQMMFLHENV